MKSSSMPKEAFPTNKTIKRYHTIIVGAGAAGIGMGVALKDFRIDDFVILEKDLIGSTFFKWTTETRFLTPSFQSTQFGLMDLNAVAINTSPAYSSGKEHLSGPEYARYLSRVAYEFQLPVHEERKVVGLRKHEGQFVVETEEAVYLSLYLIWATGEYQFPNDTPFPGAEFCVHSSSITSYRKLVAPEYTIIGGYESGVDTALNLALLGKQTTILEQGTVIQSQDQDPSISLSFYTRQRLDETASADNILLQENTTVQEVIKTDKGMYRLLTNDGYYESYTPPILATGYIGGQSQIKDLFYHENGRPQLDENDQSTKTENLFLIGPHVKHEGVIFCFIYKFRQRFAIVADSIAKQSGIDTKAAVARYRQNTMFLDDLSCCQESCTC